MCGKGKNVEMMIFTLERDEAVALLTRVNPESLARALDDPHAFAISFR